MAVLASSSLSSLAAQLTVAWDDNSTGETGFKIERSTDGVNFTQVGSVGANIVTFVDSTVVSSTTYSYRVAAYDASATSAYSNVTSATTAVAAPVAPAAVLPAFTTHPTASQTAVAGANVSLSVAVSGTPTPTIQWRKNGVAVAGATSTTFVLNAITSADAATYTAVATNSAGTATSGNAYVGVSTPIVTPVVTPPTPVVTVAPVFTLQPTATSTVSAGTTLDLTVAATGTPAPTYQWKKDGVAISGANSATLQLDAVTVFAAGNYSVVATNSAGSVTSNTSTLVVQMIAPTPTTPEIPAPVVVVPPPAPVVVVPTPVTPAPEPAPVIVVPVLPPVTPATPVVVAPPVETPEVPTAPKPSDTKPETGKAAQTSNPYASRLMNLSVRAVPGPDDRALLVGFVVSGAPKSMLVRAVGPGLATYTNMAVFQDPKLTLYDGSREFASNENWAGAEALKSNFSRLGAFPLPESSKDAAILSTFTPKPYTANVTGSGTGLALAEIYDADPSGPAAGRLVNLSARAHAGPGDGVLIVGFVISGDTPLRVLIRAIGPTLANYGVTTALADPQLQVYRGSTMIQHNDNWSGDSALAAAFSKCGAFTLPNPASKDAALIVTLAPGAYTAIVSGVAGTDGIALAEVYELQE
jgi:hypothetical protein